MGRVTGVGGIFFRSADPEAQRAWYKQHLGLNTDAYGTNFETRQTLNPERKSYLQWSPFSESTDYFEKAFMINYRVDNLDEILESLGNDGIELIGEIQVEDYGKFAHIRDPEGNRIELWEPVDEEYEKMLDGRTF